MKTEHYDVLVIGGGIAGLFYAIKCANFAKVCLVTKGSLGDSNTFYAQGGIAAVFDERDSIESHINDTLIAGDGLCNLQAVELIAEKAKEYINELSALNVEFSKDFTGKFDLHREGGHSFKRIVHRADDTGRAVETSLINAVCYSKGIAVFENHFAIDLLHDNGIYYGAAILNEETGALSLFYSKITMLATGGAAHIYKRNTNPPVATGDGFAMGFRAGVEIGDMEFVQFHPTTLYTPRDEAFLITEAIRGFGAELKHKDGSTFMELYHPLKSLAPRDIVSRSIMNELARRKEECVYLDLRGFETGEIKAHFPNIYSLCVTHGLNMKYDMIPVVPAAHYMCGGVMSDLWGRTSMHNLYCCGECSRTGVHGANRLASNSLLEGMVFAGQAAIMTGMSIENIPHPSSPKYTIKYRAVSNTNDDMVNDMKKRLQDVMWQHAGIIRNAEALNSCIIELDKMWLAVKALIDNNGVNRPRYELLNMIETSMLICRGARLRKESRGCHYISDAVKGECFASNA